MNLPDRNLFQNKHESRNHRNKVNRLLHHDLHNFPGNKTSTNPYNFNLVNFCIVKFKTENPPIKQNPEKNTNLVYIFHKIHVNYHMICLLHFGSEKHINNWLIVNTPKHFTSHKSGILHILQLFTIHNNFIQQSTEPLSQQCTFFHPIISTVSKLNRY